jgi:hypothetical protein
MSRTRIVQLALAGFWAIDGLLQLQPANFTSQLVNGTILGNAENQPRPIFDSLLWASHLLEPFHVELNIAIIIVQLALACGLLRRRTVKPALALSIAWALGVWWLGEGFGGIFAGKATLLVGAPGPALLYVLLALIAWPTEHPVTSTIASAGALGERATLGAWALLWTGGAILRVAPFWFPPVYALAGDFQLGLNQEPPWLYRVNESLSHFAASAGLPLVIAIALVEAAIGIGVLTRHRRTFLTAGMLIAAVYWAFGQQLAGLLTGSATDIGAAPAMILLALTLWPRSTRSRQPHRRAPAPISADAPAPRGWRDRRQVGWAAVHTIDGHAAAPSLPGRSPWPLQLTAVCLEGGGGAALPRGEGGASSSARTGRRAQGRAGRGR